MARAAAKVPAKVRGPRPGRFRDLPSKVAPAEEQKLFTVPQAAVYLRCGHSTIRRAIARGHLAAIEGAPAYFTLIERAALDTFAATHGPILRGTKKRRAAPAVAS